MTREFSFVSLQSLVAFVLSLSTGSMVELPMNRSNAAVKPFNSNKCFFLKGNGLSGYRVFQSRNRFKCRQDLFFPRVFTQRLKILLISNPQAAIIRDPSKRHCRPNWGSPFQQLICTCTAWILFSGIALGSENRINPGSRFLLEKISENLESGTARWALAEFQRNATLSGSTFSREIFRSAFHRIFEQNHDLFLVLLLLLFLGLFAWLHTLNRKVKQQSAELLEGDERLRTIFRDSPLGIALVDSVTTQIIEANPRFTEILGRTKEELASLDLMSLIHPDDLPSHRKNMDLFSSGEIEGFNLQKRLIHSDGSWLWINTTVTPVKTKSHGHARHLCMIEDISARKRAEEALTEANRIINRSPAVVFVWKNEEGWPVEFVSDNVENLTGYTVQDFIGHKITFRGIVHSEDIVRVASEALVHRKKNTSQFFVHNPYRIVTKQGVIKWVQDKSYIRRDAKGEITHSEGVVYDITEEVRLEEQLRQAQKMESVGRLAGGVAHDFNNMLAVIIGHTEMAIGLVDAGGRVYSDLIQIHTAAMRSADLVRQLLAFARKQAILPKVLNLNETVEGTLKMLRRLIGEDLELVWNPGNEVRPVKVDPSQLDQILTNLCVNARDAIVDVGKITIETKNASFDLDFCTENPGFVPGDFVMLAVRDNGSGMDSETLAKIYEPFFTTKKAGQGTGLGLATVYGIVQQNGGFIDVLSEPGLGTTLSVYLPSYKEKNVPENQKEVAEPLLQGNETILLVEDELAILRMATMMLKAFGYTVLSADTPGEAMRLAKASSVPIHMLISDVILPGMNGPDLARNLISLFPGLKLLFMSGYTAEVIAHHGVLDEDIHFIQKPFSTQDLATKVRAVLDGIKTD